MNKTAYLLFDSRGPEIQHRAGIVAPDPFLYLDVEGGIPTVFFDAREYDVQTAKIRRLGKNIHVARLEPFLAQSAGRSGDPAVAVALAILDAYQVSTVRVSPSLPVIFARGLEQAGITVTIHDFPSERERKTEAEIAQLIAAQRVNEKAMQLAWQILIDSTIAGDQIHYQGRALTSEFMKSKIRTFLLDHGFDCPDGIIVASGEQTARPHDEGEGPLQANHSIIIDIFPRSEQTGYVADMTRTFVKGTPSAALQELLIVVERVQHEIAAGIAIGDRCADVYQRTVDMFTKAGHVTSPERGFMHGTGHSIGLAVHERPYLNNRSDRTIEPGMVFTIEPGLYYPGVGGVRIEDVVVFLPDGTKQNITQFNQPSIIP